MSVEVLAVSIGGAWGPTAPTSTKPNAGLSGGGVSCSEHASTFLHGLYRGREGEGEVKERGRGTERFTQCPDECRVTLAGQSHSQRQNSSDREGIGEPQLHSSILTPVLQVLLVVGLLL